MSGAASGSKGDGKGGGKGKPAKMDNKFFQNSTYAFDSMASQSAAIVQVAEQRLAELEHEIKKDKEGIDEYGHQFKPFRERKEFLIKRIKDNKEWVKQFDVELKRFTEKYEQLERDLATCTNETKTKYDATMTEMMKTIKWSPAFKHWDDEM